MVVISKLYPEVIKVCRPFIIEDELLKILVRKFSDSLLKSLSAQELPDSAVKCNLTYVSDFPDGMEKGSFIGLDFSGKIFRLVYVGLKGDRNYVTLSKLYEFPNQKLNESLGKIVEYIARCVNNFIGTYDISEQKIILGVTSSFQISQECLQEGKIVHWGKDFQCRDYYKKDFFNLLRVALRKLRNTRAVYLISITNNSTACLLAAMYRDPSTRIGLYLGDDTNVTYLEKYENMKAYSGDGLRSRTALGVEMKKFGDDGSLDFLRSEFDFEIDAGSQNPGEHVLDKMVSASELGEIARLCLYKLVSNGIILKGYATPALSKKDGLRTSDLAVMEMNDEDSFTRCRAVMRKLGYKEVSDEDCRQIRFVCRSVAKRSANLVAACLTALIHRMDTKYVHVVVDGYLFKEFPNYENYLNKKIGQLRHSCFRPLLVKGNKDEAAVGAGLVAFIYKDGIVKLEEKRRILPPININKYNLKNIPAACIDCECETVEPVEPVRTWKAPSNIVTESLKSVESTKTSEFSEVIEPVLTNSFDFDDL